MLSVDLYYKWTENTLNGPSEKVPIVSDVEIVLSYSMAIVLQAKSKLLITVEFNIDFRHRDNTHTHTHTKSDPHISSTYNLKM